MKFLAVFLVCSLTPFVLADDYYGSPTACQCVDRELCSNKFSTSIEPRSSKHCDGRNQVCCDLKHIIISKINDYDTNANDDDSYDYVKPSYDSGKCGRPSKISAYKRLVLPANWAKLGQIPWQAAILKNYNDSFVFISGGVLIDKNIILTTAHNVDKLKANDILVRLGVNNVQADPNKKYSSLNVRVSKIIVKDDFNKDTLENDFAVLCLDEKVKYNEVVSPICLPEPSDYIGDTARCLVSGWGKSSYNGNYSTILRYAYLNLVPRGKCQFLIRKRINDPTYVLDESFQCAGGEFGKDACTGDAGGPLSCTNKNGQQVLAGIVSWGIGCGEKNVPGVYANVRDSASLSWIKNVAIKACGKVDYVDPVKSVNSANLQNNYYQNLNNLPYSSNLPSSLPVQVAANYNPNLPINTNYESATNQLPIDQAALNNAHYNQNLNNLPSNYNQNLNNANYNPSLNRLPASLPNDYDLAAVSQSNYPNSLNNPAPLSNANYNSNLNNPLNNAYYNQNAAFGPDVTL